MVRVGDDGSFWRAHVIMKVIYGGFSSVITAVVRE